MPAPLTSRNNRPPPERNPPFRDAKLYVIATEGEVTEPHYFSLFQEPDSDLFNPKVKQLVILPTQNGESSPEHVISRLRDFRNDHLDLDEDELWIVIDVDRWGARALAKVCRDAVAARYSTAISNPFFEVWLLYHHSQTITPKKASILADVKSICGNTKKKFNLETYKKKIPQAVANAKKHAEKINPNRKSRWPTVGGTDVFKLVDALLPNQKK